MNISPLEMNEVAAAQAPARFDIYGGIHKALRAMMTDTLLALGRTDTNDPAEVDSACQRIVQLLNFCASHVKHENDFVHAAIEARATGASAELAHEHDEHLASIARLIGQTLALPHAPVSQKARLAQVLYRELAVFVGENFLHMEVEESAHNAVLWSRYSDLEIVGIHQALVASIPPEEMMFTLRWLVPFMNPAERLAMFKDMQAHAPAPAFEAALAVAQPHLSCGEWTKLARGLGLPTVPGLVQA
ncbi:MAG: hemerythrin domain-containing protein [Pseudomonadota bacterium]